MRNAGDRTPGGSASRRHRSSPPEQPSPAGAGGPSLFTPAYRVSHENAGHNPPASGSPSAAAPGHGGADSTAAGYGWSDSEPGPRGAGSARSGYSAEGSGPGWADDPLAAGYGWAADDQAAGTWPGSPVPETAVQPRGNAVRGFPPAPGEPLPVYPPGPFAAWNRGHSGKADGDRNSRDGGLSVSGYAGSSRQLATATITPDEFDTDYSLPAIKDPVPGKAGSDGAARHAVDRTTRAPGGRQPGGPGPEVPGRRGDRAAGRARAARTRRKRASAWLAIGTAVVIIAAVAFILVRIRPGTGNPTAGGSPTNTPAARTSPTPPPGQWEYIGSRKTDPVPLTLVELYPAVITSAATTYTRTTEDRGKNCHGSLVGSALQTAVRAGGCTQELRATYLSKTAKIMATIGVFNLRTFALAKKAATNAGRSEFVAQLPAKAGPTKAIGQGTGLEEALVKGHYLVLIWAEATNLSAPPSTVAGRARFSAFMSLLVKRTVNVSLTTRMVDGRPPKRH